MFLDDDLVDTVKPGDRVRCAGIYRALAHNSAVSTGVFRTVVLANSLAAHDHDNAAVAVTSRDVANIRTIVQSISVLSKMLNEIYCHRQHSLNVPLDIKPLYRQGSAVL